jgi:hypothetical protein
MKLRRTGKAPGKESGGLNVHEGMYCRSVLFLIAFDLDQLMISQFRDADQME